MVHKAVGYTVDVLMLAASAYMLSQNYNWSRLTSEGVGAVIADLPSPRSAPLTSSNATDVLAQNLFGAGTSTAFEFARWYEYVLGSDCGSGLRSNPVLQEFHELNAWKNSLILPLALRQNLPHVLAIWLRNMIAGWAMYYITGGLWYLYLEVAKKGKKDEEQQADSDDMWKQILVSNHAMVWYSFMPTLGEWLIEKGWTQSYHTIDSVGGIKTYLGYLAAYFFFVEWGIYWVHRYLHDNKTLYKLLHHPHHIYNKNLSPFAGLAFHPFDGMLQASPYVLGLFVLPVHFWTHEVLLFFTAIWTANIHDTLTGDTEPVMGSAYHTLHHTLYEDNYGQVFVLFDLIHDTMTPPPHQVGWWERTGLWKRKLSDQEIEAKKVAAAAENALLDEAIAGKTKTL